VAGPAPPALKAGASPKAPPPESRGIWIYRRAKDGAFTNPLRAEPTTAASFEDTAVAPGEEWCYAVRFVASTDPVVESASAGEVCAAFKDIAAPAAPIGLAVVLHEDGVEVSWSPSAETDLAGYRVYRAAPPGAAPQRVAELPPEQTSLRDGAAKRGILAVYTVTAVDKAGNESPASSAVQVRP
jgi:hypothetical protein